MKNVNEVLNKLQEKINDNKSKNNNVDYNNKRDNTTLVEAMDLIRSLAVENNKLISQLQKEDNTISTTQFFNPSLAKDFYNMNGNSLQINSYLAIRQMLGIVNNNTPNVLQTIPGVSQNNGSSIINGTGVGLTTVRKVQGWWLWTMILNRIAYFQNMFDIQCEDKKLVKALYTYLMNVVLSGYGAIEKDGEDYIAYSLANIKIDEKGKLVSAQKFNTAFVLNELRDNSPDAFGLSDFTDGDNVVYGSWRSNGYNIWYYVMCYLLNSVDLLYVFWNRSRLNKTIILQMKGNNSTASVEAENFVNPYQNVVTVNTVNTLDDNNSSSVELQNRYEVKDLGNGQETQFSFDNFVNWTNWWDNEIGLRSTPPGSGDGTRSITDEVQPEKLKLNKQQYDMLKQLQYLCDMIKEKWNIEVNITLKDLEDIKNNPETKEESGNENEEIRNNG